MVVQVYDIYEDMQKPLREYDQAALLTDPLVVLTCGHVFPMSSMDGFIDLEAAYAKDSSGKWTKTRSVTAEVLSSHVWHLLLPTAPSSSSTCIGSDAHFCVHATPVAHTSAVM